MALGFGALLALLALTCTRGGQRRLQAASDRLSGPSTVRIETGGSLSRRVRAGVGAAFGAAVVATVIAGLFGWLPIRFMQPVSAVYCVPFLVFLFVAQRRSVSPLMLLWPGLYALHAAALVAIPAIPAGGAWVQVHMVVSVAGYGLLAAGAAWLRGRCALGRARMLARQDADHAGE
jgi:hypothetical protein